MIVYMATSTVVYSNNSLVMEQFQKYFDANKDLWNKGTVVHKDSSFYDLPSFLIGKNSLNEIEKRELGNIDGKTILHLQCHFGMDSLSMARMGAKVTGVDLSDTAINEAQKLNNQLGLNANFICSNVYDLGTVLSEQFDIVFTSYGVIALRQVGRNNFSFFKARWIFLYGRISSCRLDD